MRTESETRDQPEPTDDLLNLVVGKLCQITRESTLDHAIRVGSLIIHYFYKGDMKVWRKRGRKTQSFRRLARHPQLPMSASALYRCVAIFELCDRLDVVSRWSRITVSHLRVVLRLGEEEQCRLISAANSERWSVQRLEEEARKVASSPARRRGRTAPPDVLRVASSVDKLLRSSGRVLEGLPDVKLTLKDEAMEHYAHVEQRIHMAIRCLEEARAGLACLGRKDAEQAPKVESLRGHGVVRSVGRSAAEPFIPASA